MGPDLELNGNSQAAMGVSASKDKTIVTQGREDVALNCASNFEDNTFGMEALLFERTTEDDGSENMELNITDFSKATDAGLDQGECQDVTEYSSSFGDTESGTQNGLMLADDEVESHLFTSNASIFDGCFDTFPIRKKKLTLHWRKFIRPLMWRCKWVELQIKELQSQTIKYDRELEVYDQRKQLEFENLALENFDAKSIPFAGQIPRDKVMKRKKRRRIEETTDLTTYMLQHNLFSYYEKKRSAAVDGALEADCGNLAKVTNGDDEFGNDGWSSLEFRNDDTLLEQTLQRIEVAHSQIHKLKTRIDKVISENPGKFCSVNKLSLLAPSDALTSSDQDPASPPNSGHGVTARSLFAASQHVSENNMGELPVMDSPVLSHAEISNMIGSMIQPQAVELYEDSEDDILIQNKEAKEKLDDLGNVRSQLIEKPQVTMEDQKTIPLVQVSETGDLPSETAAPNVQPNVKSRSTSKSNFPRNTRRRGRRKAGSKRWSKRSSG